MFKYGIMLLSRWNTLQTLHARRLKARPMPMERLAGRTHTVSRRGDGGDWISKNIWKFSFEKENEDKSVGDTERFFACKRPLFVVCCAVCLCRDWPKLILVCALNTRGRDGREEKSACDPRYS